MNAILEFPTPDTPTRNGATPWQIWRSRIRETIGRLANRIGLPGAISDCEIDDIVTGQHIRVTVTQCSTHLWIDGRDYYFDRLTGKLFGTGMLL